MIDSRNRELDRVGLVGAEDQVDLSPPARDGAHHDRVLAQVVLVYPGHGVVQAYHHFHVGWDVVLAPVDRDPFWNYDQRGVEEEPRLVAGSCGGDRDSLKGRDTAA